jgi:bifunctional non-homologous end joining protein LigD
MLATLGDAPLVDDRLAYEPKYDGIRALVSIEPGGGPDRIRISSRLGNDKTAQFPDVVEALALFARRLKAPVLLDGEIVALDESGEPAGFQRLQSRMHLTNPRDIAVARAQPVAFVAFDVLRDGPRDLRALPLTARRARLERIHGNTGSGRFRLSELAAGDGRALYQRAIEHGWEGIIAKRLDSPYASGRRSEHWTKLKLVARQECVIGGWTEPRNTRAHFGALLLGLPGDGALEYVGHTGAGFTVAELDRLARMLAPLEVSRCPFHPRPPTNERPHWVRPEIVVEVKFAEWTRDGKMRAPVYLGVRDDLRPDSVRRERATTRRPPRAPVIEVSAPRRRVREPEPLPARLERLVTEIESLEERRLAGTLALPGGARLDVSHLERVLWPRLGITKGELMRYYVSVSPYVLPAVADRPLVMKRFPNGVNAKAFYQQRAPATVPRRVRVAVLPGDVEVPSRLVGGSLVTLLYMVQLAVVSQDPWFSRVRSPQFPDQLAFDLDPMPGVPFARVLDVARWIRDELERLGVPSVPKTSGADGMHVYVPLPARTSWESARLFAQIVATIVADRHPQAATVERAVHARGRTVYVDYLQNLRGKTLATAYSARATDDAGVSTPLTWDEVDRGIDRGEFTIRTMRQRLGEVGDVWARLRKRPVADLRAALDNVGASPARGRLTGGR